MQRMNLSELNRFRALGLMDTRPCAALKTCPADAGCGMRIYVLSLFVTRALVETIACCSS